MKKRFNRFRCLALLIGLILVAPCWSQNAKVSLTPNVKSLKSLFTEIEKQTDYRFSYDRETGKNPINYSAPKDATVQSVLKSVLPSLGLEYSMMSDNVIAISKKKSSSGNQTKKQKTQITGTITDEAGEPLIGATVFIKGTGTAAVTDMEGKYTIDAIPGETLQVYT